MAVRRFVPMLTVALIITAAACSQRTTSSVTGTIASTAAPVYPGSKVESASNAFSTRDSFATVYDFYKKNLPAGSEQSHITSPAEAAVFLFGSAGDRLSVTISSSPLCCKTLIVIARA